MNIIIIIGSILCIAAVIAAIAVPIGIRNHIEESYGISSEERAEKTCQPAVSMAHSCHYRVVTDHDVIASICHHTNRIQWCEDCIRAGKGNTSTYRIQLENSIY